MSVTVEPSAIFSAIQDAVTEEGYAEGRSKIVTLNTGDGAEIWFDEYMLIRVFCLLPGNTNSIPRIIVQMYKGRIPTKTLLAVAHRIDEVFEKENFDIRPRG